MVTLRKKNKKGSLTPKEEEELFDLRLMPPNEFLFCQIYEIGVKNAHTLGHLQALKSVTREGWEGRKNREGDGESVIKKENWNGMSELEWKRELARHSGKSILYSPSTMSHLWTRHNIGGKYSFILRPKNCILLYCHVFYNI